ncbi:MAG: hypothetical protein KGK07_12880 [Chloroflexota bacterium]|nr:hypothetical protein [Chloroflexota bacterium]
MTEDTRAVVLIRVDFGVMRAIRKAQGPREAYNDTLRRLLGLEERREAQGAPGRVNG